MTIRTIVFRHSRPNFREDKLRRESSFKNIIIFFLDFLNPLFYIIITSNTGSVRLLIRGNEAD